MSFITYMVDKKSGRKYAYRQENFWDSGKGQSRARRTYLGRVDPETGEIIPKRGSSAKVDEGATPAGEEAGANGAADGLEEEVARLRARVAELESALARLSAEAVSAIGGDGR
jgi:uncharacterized protein YceH (UPF0502 family)